MDKEKQQERLLMVGGVFVTITVITLFYLLVGSKNREETPKAIAQEQGLMMDLPEPPNDEKEETNKLAILAKEERRLMSEREREKKQNNSFDLLDQLNASKENEEEKESDKGIMNKDVKEKISLDDVNSTSPKEMDTASPLTQQNKSTERKKGRKKTTNSLKKEEGKQESYEEGRERRKLEKENEMRKLRERYLMEKEEEAEGKKETSEEGTEISRKVENTPSRKKRSGFHRMGGEGKVQESNAMRVVVHGEQKNITTSSQVRLRLLDPVTINNIEIPRNTIFYGIARFSENRMNVTTANICKDNDIIPFEAEIYDMDGFKGIYIPENLLNEAGTDASSNTIAKTKAPANVTSTTGLINTAVNAASDAVKSATNKKVKQVKVDLPTNYKLLIRIKKK